MKFFNRWRRSGKQVKSEIIGTAIFGLGLCALGSYFLLIAYDPSWILSPSYGGRWLSVLLENPHAGIRVPSGLILGLPIIGLGMFVLRFATDAFRSNRWKPRVEDSSRSSRVDER